jgi:hypothetical protein
MRCSPRFVVTKMSDKKPPHANGEADESVDNVHPINSKRPHQPVEWRDFSSVFETHQEIEWVCGDLLIGPGRPTIIAAHGGTGKSMLAQALALSVASGEPLFGKFQVKQGRVAYMDYEVGSASMNSRWRRLLAGMGMSGLESGMLSMSDFPDIKLDSNEAESVFASACRGFDLVIIDALKAAAPNTKENDSDIRRALDVLTRISSYTNTAFVVLHHAAKFAENQNQKVRGSGAIRDAAGCVMLLEGDKDFRTITFDKKPASIIDAMPDKMRIHLKTTRDTASFYVSTKDASGPCSSGTLDERAVALLSASEMTKTELRDALKLNAKSMASLMKRLTASNLVSVDVVGKKHTVRALPGTCP